jgi:hypothetical protein
MHDAISSSPAPKIREEEKILGDLNIETAVAEVCALIAPVFVADGVLLK